MMQPRDAHDGDCAMEEAGGHSSPLPPVMTTDGLASSPAASSNHHQAPSQRSEDSPITSSSADSVAAAAAAALVGARRRKAVRVVKHQQLISPVKMDEPEESGSVHIKTTEQGNTSMDTGVSSDLSESRPSLVGEEEEDDEDDEEDDDDRDHLDGLSHGSESGLEFDGRHGHSDWESDGHHQLRRDRQQRRRRDGRKRQMSRQDHHVQPSHDSRCHPIVQQRITTGQDSSLTVGGYDDGQLVSSTNAGIDLSSSLTPTRVQQKRARLDDEQEEEEGRLRCPECGDVSSTSRAHLIRHVQMAHPAALVRHPWAFGPAAIVQQAAGNNKSDLADIPSILHLASTATTTPSGRHVNDVFLHADQDDKLLTNPPEEYKNEEDDPFSAVLREMKIKGEFPCRLCEAVFPNLRALKGHNRKHLTHAPYRCNMCPSTSHDKGALIRHMRTHNGERPYECRDCQYAFTTKANCERHLRNRHGKLNRDALRASIIYHLSEDAAANRAGGDQSGDDYKSGHSALDLSADRDDSNDFDDRRRQDEDEDDELTDYPSEEEDMEQDGPLDLTVDVLDLRKRRQESMPVSLVVPAVPAATVQTPAVKIQPSPVAPATPTPPEVKPSVFAPPYFGAPYPGAAASLAGLPAFFYPGLGGASYSAFLESKLAEMGNPAVDLSALALAAAHHDAIRQAQQAQQQQAHQNQPVQPPTKSLVEGLLMPAVKKFQQQSEVQEIRSASLPVTPIKMEKKSSSSSNHHSSSTNNDPGIKMVLKNGVLVKKQKQRRYRTERPFGCEHCTARFTLRSNMERHIKQQHPDIWSTRPRGHRRSACALTKTSSSSLPTMVELKSHHGISGGSLTPTQHSTSGTPGLSLTPTDLAKVAPISEQVRQAVQQKLNKKRRNSEHSDDEDDEDMEQDEDDGGDEDEEETEGALVIDERKDGSVSVPHKKAEVSATAAAADLASVSKLLTNAVAQSFQQYFTQHRIEEPEEPTESRQSGHNTNRASPSEGNTDEMDEGECTSISDGHSAGSDFGGNRSDGGQAVKGKKKSAYSNAPHRVSCPYCSRKFPWTSSLRRHILTHTGQKPYKCPQCPLWFTTKSNCDRHLLRKHGNQIHGGGHSAGNNNNAASSVGSAGSAAENSRNVPDRPYKCALCPSSTFATSDNLKKHVDNKHCPAHGGMTSPESIAAADEEKSGVHPTSPSDVGHQQQSQQSGGSAEQLPFKCHLCDDTTGYAERQEVLDHLQRDHTDEFHDLVGKVGALVAEPPPMPSAPTSDEGEDYDSVRGKFPDYVNRKVICAFCLRRFWSAEDLRRHMRTHSGERPYQCDVCSRRFTLKHSMLRHRRKHGESGHAEESDEEEEEEEEESGSDRSHRRQAAAAAAAAANSAAAKAKVCMQALWSGANASAKKSGMRLRVPFGSDLIGNLLGIPDTSIVEQLMSKPADDAARLLGVPGNRV